MYDATGKSGTRLTEVRTMKRFFACTTVLAMMAMATSASAADEWWRVPSDSDTTPEEIRLVLVHRLESHWEDVREVRQARREARREARLAAQTTTPIYTAGIVSDVEAASLLRNAGFPEWAIPTMIGYMHRESGGDPTATNQESGACGLWQMYPCPGSAAYDPQTNANMAYAKFDGCGLGPWAIPPYC